MTNSEDFNPIATLLMMPVAIGVSGLLAYRQWRHGLSPYDRLPDWYREMWPRAMRPWFDVGVWFSPWIFLAIMVLGLDLVIEGPAGATPLVFVPATVVAGGLLVLVIPLEAVTMRPRFLLPPYLRQTDGFSVLLYRAIKTLGKSEQH